ncbi:DUF4277 domain-containing protein [Streptosporangium roseum]|uniref:DUF4277 domain-containing protein n=1 Tax=Streptosporangium roseum TaxID=2001 RepID=UPI001E3BBD72|nr:DUF4277 domain-containing protein [Streptosporangium roseum]
MEKTLGALPVVADFCRKLKIADVVDALCPVGDLAELAHGQVIGTMQALQKPTGPNRC